MNFRNLDATAVNVIAVYPKVQQVLYGKIPTPEVAEFFITNYCSFCCPHCRCAKTHEGKHSFIDITLYKKIIDELLETGCKTIEFGGGGEPLEHPDILEILHYLKEKKMRCGIITNGYQLIGNSRLADIILEVADWVRISLDAVSDDSYQRIHGRKDLSYTLLKSALASFSQKASTSDNPAMRTRLGLKLIIQQFNRHELVMALDETLEIGADYLQFKWLENHPFAIPKEERKLIDLLINKLKTKAEGKIPIDYLPGYGGETDSKTDQPCLLSVLHPLIDWDGKVYICAFFHHRKDSHCLGDLSAESFEKIWYSPEHKECIEKVQRHQCVPNCPIKRYNSIIDFIRQEGYRFHYI
jgi:MoaA/NifB/PqqE/SkfB family radical SAM enzyme